MMMMAKALAVIIIAWVNPDGTNGILLEEYQVLQDCHDQALLMEETLREREWAGLVSSWDVRCVSDGTELHLTLKEKARE